MASEKVRHLRYESLRKQLQEIPYWPHRYCHKLIGRNGEPFRSSVEDLEGKFPEIKRMQESESKNGTYLSITYEIRAENVDDIISLWVASESVQDCVSIL